MKDEFCASLNKFEQDLLKNQGRNEERKIVKSREERWTTRKYMGFMLLYILYVVCGLFFDGFSTKTAGYLIAAGFLFFVVACELKTRANKILDEYISLRAYLRHMHNFNIVLFQNQKQSLDVLSELIPLPVSFDNMIKQEIRAASKLDRDITRLEKYFWTLERRTNNFAFYHVLRAMLSGEAVHFTFKTIEDFDLVAIIEKYEDTILIAEPFKTIDENEDLLESHFIYPVIHKNIFLKEYKINSESWISCEGVIDKIRDLLEESSLPENITFEIATD